MSLAFATTVDFVIGGQVDVVDEAHAYEPMISRPDFALEDVYMNLIGIGTDPLLCRIDEVVERLFGGAQVIQ